MHRKNTKKLVSCVMAASPRVAPNTYKEYAMGDENGPFLSDVLGLYNGLTVKSKYDTYFELRNPSSPSYTELYDPSTNECVAWLGAGHNLFGESGCKTGASDEDFISFNCTSGFCEYFNDAASAHFGDTRCLTAEGTANGAEVVADKCADESLNQYWMHYFEKNS
jgi:hypothetical protein